jgi:hypothetical protein
MRQPLKNRVLEYQQELKQKFHHRPLSEFQTNRLLVREIELSKSLKAGSSQQFSTQLYRQILEASNL